MNDELFCNLNGRVESCSETPFSSADDAFRLRYGVYETYLYAKSGLEYALLHWERLRHGLTILGFVILDHFSVQYFTGQVEALMAKNKLKAPARIRLQVFTEDLQAPYQPLFLIESFPLEKAMTGWLEKGIHIGLLENFQKEISAISNCKISHNRHFIPARKMMEEQGLDDVLLYNSEGRITESSMANLFWVKNGVVFTTPLSEGCLAGTIRAVIIACLQEHKIPFEERPCSFTELQSADEIFLSNGIRKIRWVREMKSFFYKNEWAQKIYKLLMNQPD